MIPGNFKCSFHYNTSIFFFFFENTDTYVVFILKYFPSLKEETLSSKNCVEKLNRSGVSLCYSKINHSRKEKESSNAQLCIAAKIHELYLSELSQLNPTVMMEFRLQEGFMLG